MNQVLDLLAITAIAIFAFRSIRSAEAGVLFGLLIKPLIDTGWDFRILGFSLIDFYSLIFLLVAYKLIFSKRLFQDTGKAFLTLWIISHFGLIFLFLNAPMSGLEGILRALFFPVALVLLPYFLTHEDQDKRRKIIRFLLIGALFAAVLTILQGLGLLSQVTARQTKGLARANSFYHDIVTVRIYIVQGFLALYFAYYTRCLKLSNFSLIALVSVLLLGGFFTYSKAFIGIVVVGVLIFLFTSRNKIKGVVFLSVLVLGAVSFGGNIVEKTSQIFVKELDYREGEMTDEGQLFSGRGMIWTDYLEEFSSANQFTQFVGFNRNVPRTHNEFLRILLLSGLIGVTSYIILFFSFIGVTLKSFLKRKPLIFLTIWCLSMLLIDAFSVIWGLYPHYMILILGFFIASVRYDEQTTETFSFEQNLN